MPIQCEFEFTLPWRHDASPEFSELRRVLLRQGAGAYVPLYELYANPETIAAFMGDEDAGTCYWKFYLYAGYDYVPVYPEFTMPLGSLTDTSKPYPIKNWADFKAYPWPKSYSMAKFQKVRNEIPSGMRMIGQMGGPFETAESLLGYETLCYFLYDEPELVEEIFVKIREHYVRVYELMAQQEGVGALVVSDDMGYKGGTMISAEHLRKYVKPIHSDLTKIIHDAGLPCILHSCGNLEEIMDEWISDVKIDAKHSFEDNICAVEESFARYSGRIAILGGYDLNRLCADAPDEVYNRSTKLLHMGKDGRYALGSGNSIPAFVPHENYVAMLNAAKNSR